MSEQFYKATDLTTGQVLASRVRIAQDFKSRSVGLLNRASLDRDEGLLIKPCNSIHTFFMKFSIDAIFLAKNGKVVSIATNLAPWKLFGALIAGFMVLELPAGKSDECGIMLGHVIIIA